MCGVAVNIVPSVRERKVGANKIHEERYMNILPMMLEFLKGKAVLAAHHEDKRVWHVVIPHSELTVISVSKNRVYGYDPVIRSS